jgi:hypothetical protein
VKHELTKAKLRNASDAVTHLTYLLAMIISGKMTNDLSEEAMFAEFDRYIKFKNDVVKQKKSKLLTMIGQTQIGKKAIEATLNPETDAENKRMFLAICKTIRELK